MRDTAEATRGREGAILAIARALNAALTVETAVAHVLELIGEALAADAVSIFVRESDDRGSEDLQVSFARRGGGLERGAVSIALGLSGLVIETGRPVLVDDVSREPRFRGKLDATFGTRTRSLIAVPMARRDAVNGLIEAIRERVEPFGEDDLEFLTAVGAELAVAVENARLISRLQEDVRTRELLLEAARAVGSSLDLEKVMGALFTTLGELVPYDAVGVYLLDRETGALADFQHRGYPAGAAGLLSERPGKGISGWAARHRTSVNAGRVKDDLRYLEARPSTQSEVAVPIIRHGDVIGVITVESDEPDAYTDRQVALLEIVAAHVAGAITNARLYQRDRERSRIDHEIELARQIQRAALPAVPLVVGGVEAAGVNVASNVVGGDYFDYFRASDRHVAIALADVSGHGLSASLLMSAVRSGVRLTADAETSPAELIGRLARLLYESTPSNQFVATVFGLLEIGSGELVVTNGGHVPPLRIGAGGGHELLPSDGLVLGAFPDSTYREQRLQLQPGDILVFYTDGLTEMSNPEGEEFGCERLAAIVSRCRDQRLADIIAEVRRGAREFRGAAPREDDVTLMLVRWNGPAG